MSNEIKRCCIYCHSFYNDVETLPEKWDKKNTNVSHGICPNCNEERKILESDPAAIANDILMDKYAHIRKNCNECYWDKNNNSDGSECVICTALSTSSDPHIYWLRKAREGEE